MNKLTDGYYLQIMKKTPSEPSSTHSDDSTILWILTLIFITLTSLTVNAYSGLENNDDKQSVVNHQTVRAAEQSSDLQLINAKSPSQTNDKTLNM